MRLLLIVEFLIVTASLSAQSVLFERLARIQGDDVDVQIGSTVCDLNGDGYFDGLIGYGLGSYAFSIYFGDGQGHFKDVSNIKSPLWDYVHFTYRHFGMKEGPATVDIDLDGDLDVVVARGSQSPNPVENASSIFLNDGTGKLTEATGRLPRHFELHDVAYVFDANGDRWPDILLQAYSDRYGQNRLYLSSQAGRQFVDASSFIPEPSGDSVARMLPVDVDGDGDLDIVVARGAPTLLPMPNSLWLNDGTGRFSLTKRSWPPHHDCTTWVEAGDIDGDGDIDLVFSNRRSSGPWNGFDHRLYINDGQGGFTDRVFGAVASSLDKADGPHWLLDFDQDGDLDVLIDHHDSQRVAAPVLLLNDGKGNFTDATGTLWPWLPDARVRVGDFDSDGDPDVRSNQLVLPIFSYVHIWVNLSRQLHLPAAPSIGTTCDVEIYAKRGSGLGIPLLSFAERRTQLGSMGDLFLDPTGLVVFNPVLFDKVEKHTLKVPIPPQISLRGLTLVWQAWIIDPARPELARFTGKFADKIQ